MSRTVASSRSTAAPRTAGSARTPLPTPAHMQPGTLFEDFESGWTVLSGGTVTHASEHVKTGTKSLKCVTNVGANLFAEKTGISRSLADVTNWALWIFVESPFGESTPSAQIAVTFFFSKDGFSTSLQSSSTNLSLTPGWNHVVLGRSDISNSGATTWTDTFTSMRLKVIAISGQTLTVHVDSLSFNTTARPLIVIDFDDGWDSAKSEGFDYMSPRGLVANSLVVSSFLGQASRLTAADVQTLYDGGWDISNHTDDHTNLQALDESTALARWVGCDTVLRASGWLRGNCNLHAAYPNGGYGAGVLAANVTAGFLTVRGTEGSLLPPEIDNQYRCRVKYVTGLTENSAAILNGHTDRAISAGAGARFVLHRIVSGSPSVDSELGRSAFQGWMNYLSMINSIKADIVTWTEAYSLISGCRRPAR